MKVALLLSGQIRCAKHCFPSVYKHILQPYSPDVFIETWIPNSNVTDRFGKAVIDDCNIEELIQLYRPKNINIEDISSPSAKRVALTSMNINSEPHVNPKNVLLMYYKLMKVFKNVSLQDYDFIIRSRFDLFFHDFPNLNNFDKSCLYIPNGYDWGGINDLFAIGNYENLEKYCSLFNYLVKYISEDKQTIHPETILKYHLESENLKIQRFPLNIQVIGR